MTHVYDDPEAFTDDMLAGFLDLYADDVVGVRGGVVRATQTPAGKVTVVVGGGSGHYPAFCGVVGPGFADGAVVGNIFTSPSADDAVSVGREVVSDAGLLFITGNYAGDVMNFTQARERLVSDGVDARTLFVTDDIASAPPAEQAKRRGIAGDFVVFKIAGAAADSGYSLDEVERVARHANSRTRTLGVAFAGCTMPGAQTPLFTVPDRMVGVGLGIHGEPGVAEEPLPSATELARDLVSRVTAEISALPDHRRVGVILNGLGATKYEELFLLWGRVAGLLRDAGYTLVAPEVGELVTSLDMAGCSLTLVALDDELETLWLAPADTPAFRRGASPAGPGGARRAAHRDQHDDDDPIGPATSAAEKCAQNALEALTVIHSTLVEAAEQLGALDAVAGDGDHGRGMVKGSTAALRAAKAAAAGGAGVATLLSRAGSAWAGEAGGTSGVLWGAGLARIGETLGDDAAAIGAHDVVEAMSAGAAAVQELGHAVLGDKTMVDSLVPFVQALEAAIADGRELADAWRASASAATRAATDTAHLAPRVGRARPLAERSIGTPDPGAVSLAMCLTAVADIFADAR